MMAMSNKLDFVKIVTREHGEVFADEWEEASRSSGSLTEASTKAHIMTWPDNETDQTHFHEIEHEIARRVYDELRDSIIDTYVRIANEVLTRERRHLVKGADAVRKPQ
jgi:hypothetical protein